jgi:hypothetical protein
MIAVFCLGEITTLALEKCDLPPIDPSIASVNEFNTQPIKADHELSNAAVADFKFSGSI